MVGRKNRHKIEIYGENFLDIDKGNGEKCRREVLEEDGYNKSQLKT